MDKAKLALILSALVVAALIAWAVANNMFGLSYKDEPASGSALAQALFVVTVFVERATAIIAATWFLTALRQAQVEGEKEVRTVSIAQDRLRLILAFVIGTLVSCVGVRTLSQLLTVDPTKCGTSDPWGCTQATAFQAVDILITAGLIAGGSEGIHAIADLLAKYGKHLSAQLSR